jgi:RNA polymerase sigma-70 factor, ECF subfamily
MIRSTAFAKDLPVAEDDELASLVERYQHRLYRYLTRLVGPGAAADDLFQQTWLNVVRQLGRYDGRRSFDTWLFAIAHNAAIDVLRRRPGESLDEQTGSWPAAGPDALDMVLNAERAAILASEVDALPALYREVVTLRFEEGMKLEQIAEVTGAPLSTVKSRLQRALEILRRSLSDRWRKEDLL